jgi:homocysteine S-methyltransferase
MQGSALRVWLARPKPLILDGGLGTLLESMGVTIKHPLWSTYPLLNNQAALFEAHCAFLSAGAEIISTATYQASFLGLSRQGVDAVAARELLQRSVQLAKQAAI